MQTHRLVMNFGQYQILHVHIFQILSLFNSHIKHQTAFAENFEPLRHNFILGNNGGEGAHLE